MSPKVWLISGCSSGFGAALVREALSRGDAVIATARNPAKISDLKEAGASTLALDVTASLTDLKKVAEDAFKIHGRIDYLVNNAGYVSPLAHPYHQNSLTSANHCNHRTKSAVSKNSHPRKPKHNSTPTSLAC